MTSRPPIRVLIAHEPSPVRSALAMTVRSYGDLELAGEVGTGQQAIEVCDRLQPDVLLIGIELPQMDSITTIRAIHRAHPEIRIIALDATYADDMKELVLRAGASEYLPQNVPAEELVKAIRGA